MTGSLEDVVRAQREGCRIGGSTLYTDVLDRVALDVRGGGPCRAVLEPFGAEPHAAAAVLRFLAAVHALVLDGEAPDLAAHYPSAGGAPGPGLGDAFVATVGAHAALLVERTHDPIQTNEVGRSASLVGGFLLLAATGPPLRVLEIGASAGLNLLFDQFRFGSGPGAIGPADAPVRFDDPWAGGPGPRPGPLPVAERRGCDARPLDPAQPADRLRLRAALWPDQPERRRRLDAALEVAARVPAPVDRADAATWLPARLDRRVPGTTTVVVHSIVAQYLAPATRRTVEAAIAEAGRRATADAPIAWLRMEPASATEAEVRLTRWPGAGAGAHAAVDAGATRVLARSAFHGPPVRWRG